MNTTDTSAQSGQGLLSTLRGKIGAAILGLLVLNALGVGGVMLTAWGVLPASTRIILAVLFILAVAFGILALKILQREAGKGVSDISAVFQNLQGQEADLSCTMQDIDNPDLQHISACYNSFLASVRELVERIRKMGIDIALDSTRMPPVRRTPTASSSFSAHTPSIPSPPTRCAGSGSMRAGTDSWSTPIFRKHGRKWTTAWPDSASVRWNICMSWACWRRT